jgi:hypothetical protein
VSDYPGRRRGFPNRAAGGISARAPDEGEDVLVVLVERTREGDVAHGSTSPYERVTVTPYSFVVTDLDELRQVTPSARAREGARVAARRIRELYLQSAPRS